MFVRFDLLCSILFVQKCWSLLQLSCKQISKWLPMETSTHECLFGSTLFYLPCQTVVGVCCKQVETNIFEFFLGLTDCAKASDAWGLLDPLPKFLVALW